MGPGCGTGASVRPARPLYASAQIRVSSYVVPRPSYDCAWYSENSLMTEIWKGAVDLILQAGPSLTSS